MASREVMVRILDLPEIKKTIADLTYRAETAEAAIDRARGLADVSGWHVYESTDTGDVYPAQSVQDLVADVRAALDGSETP